MSTRVSVTPRRLVIASLIVWSACVVLGLVAGAPLSHDEAAYAVLARDGHELWRYRPIGLLPLAKLGILLGGSDIAMRAASAVLSLTLIGAVAAIGRRLGPWTGAWAAAIVAGTHSFTARGFQLLNDIPSTVCLLLAATVIIDELERDEGPSYRLTVIAPLLALSIYVRYGSVLSIGILGITAAVLWWRSLIARPGPLLATLALFAILLVPFVTYSLRTTGSATGILMMSRDVAQYPLGHGLVQFLLSNPLSFYGVLAPPVMLAGLLGLLRRSRPRVFLGLVAIAQIGALGMFSAGSARFVFLAVVFLIVLGVGTIAGVVRWPRVAGALVVASWVGMIGATVPIQRHIAAKLRGMMTAAAAIRADAAGRPCVVIAPAITQLIWYSGCAGTSPAHLHDEVPPGARVYAATMPGRPIDPVQLSEALLADPISLTGGAWYMRPRAP